MQAANIARRSVTADRNRSSSSSAAPARAPAAMQGGGTCLAQNSEAMKQFNDHFDAACKYMETQRAEKHGGGAPYPDGKLATNQRLELAAVLTKALSVNNGLARAIVNKLNYSKRGKEVLFETNMPQSSNSSAAARTPTPSLQQRFDAAMRGGGTCLAQNAKTMNDLAQELAARSETHALIRVWDKLKAGGCADAATRAAVEKLHARGKGKIPAGNLKVRAVSNELAPARRLHKICKGAVLSGRSDAARDHFDAACKYMETLRAEKHGGGAPYPSGTLGCKDRFKLAAVLMKALGVKKDVARGIVTKLKQTKRGKQLLYEK